MFISMGSRVATVYREPTDSRFRRDRGSTFLYHVNKALLVDGHVTVKKRACFDGLLVPYEDYYIRCNRHRWVLYNSSSELANKIEQFNKSGQCCLTLYRL